MPDDRLAPRDTVARKLGDLVSDRWLSCCGAVRWRRAPRLQLRQPGHWAESPGSSCGLWKRIEWRPQVLEPRPLVDDVHTDVWPAQMLAAFPARHWLEAT
eukprot:scaffold581_cov263-Pinguiococcus_pyrenoidosus.AAC.1